MALFISVILGRELSSETKTFLPEAVIKLAVSLLVAPVGEFTVNPYAFVTAPAGCTAPAEINNP